MSSGAAISEEILLPGEDEQRKKIDATVTNSHRLKAWLTSRGLLEFDNGVYRLDTDPPRGNTDENPPDNSRTIGLSVTHPDFDLNYTLYRDRSFELEIDYTKWASGQRPQFRTGRKSIYKDLTDDEADIIGFYTAQFLDTPRED